ncbi:MAG: hypothetical protein DRG69_09805 [Deltaproteobacteria bacterium]|nr:MAG: hypothetical protein DRG69_09805 [Deltaproteobacteria bacterium]
MEREAMFRKFNLSLSVLFLFTIYLTGCAGSSPGMDMKQQVETFGCEANPTGNPIGGGEGYRDIFTHGDFTAKNTDELLTALKRARPGQVIFVPDGVKIDLSAYHDVKIPGGVTLAGTRGLKGSVGAVIFTKRKKGTLFVSAGENIRITGLRFEGPYSGRVSDEFNAYFIRLNHYGAEIDNCEIYNFNAAAISVSIGAMKVYIHHNYIHHCQQDGGGYGVSANSSDVHIIANKFDYCRHHIASSGSPGAGYEAAWNLVGPHATSHNFDVHGGRDRGDGTDIAGDWFDIHHNTFLSSRYHVGIRGTPCQIAKIHHNWFTAPSSKRVFTSGNTKIYRNVYGPGKKLEE